MREDRLHSAAIPNVTALAAAGHINREVAVHERFITVATVDRHLRRVYRKLGVDGRSAFPPRWTRCPQVKLGLRAGDLERGQRPPQCGDLIVADRRAGFPRVLCA